MGLDSCKTFIPAMLGTVAAILGTAANLYCETVKFPQSTSEGTVDVSPFYYRTRDVIELFGEPVVITTCRNYRYLDREFGFDFELDAKAVTVRAFAIMTPLIGCLGLLMAYLAPCLAGAPERWRGMFPVFCTACLFQGLTLLILSSSICTNNPVMQFLEAEYPKAAETFPEECEKGIGFTLNIIAVVFWFLAGVSAMVLPPPTPDEPVQISQTVTYQQNPDGTVQETNVAVVKGHNVTAEATAEPEEARK